MAFQVWSKVNLNGDHEIGDPMHLKFEPANTRNSADILIKWTDQTKQNVLRYDGRVGNVGFVDVDDNQIIIDLDLNENFVLKLIDVVV